VTLAGLALPVVNFIGWTRPDLPIWSKSSRFESAIARFNLWYSHCTTHKLCPSWIMIDLMISSRCTSWWFFEMGCPPNHLQNLTNQPQGRFQHLKHKGGWMSRLIEKYREVTFWILWFSWLLLIRYCIIHPILWITHPQLHLGWPEMSAVAPCWVAAVRWPA